jgi:hypothetical protein
MKTARSMGDVLYIAPNLDKSVQYLGDKFSSNSTGIIFHGDLLVVGTPPSHADRITKKETNWTYLTERFNTEEIGLVDANKQYIIHSAYLIEKIPLKKKPNLVTENTRFKKPVPFTDYLQEKGISVSEDVMKKILKQKDAPADTLVEEANKLLEELVYGFYSLKPPRCKSSIIMKKINGVSTAVALKFKFGKPDGSMFKDATARTLKNLIDRVPEELDGADLAPFPTLKFQLGNVPDVIYCILNPSFTPPPAKQPI